MPPELPPSAPAAKWKLGLLVWLSMYVCSLAHVWAGTPRWLRQCLPGFLVEAVITALVVPLVSYVLLPLLLRVPYVTPWLSCPRKRSRWAVREVLEEGFLLFSVPPPPKPSDALLRRLERLEGQTERLRKMLSGAQVPFLCACA